MLNAPFQIVNNDKNPLQSWNPLADRSRRDSRHFHVVDLQKGEQGPITQKLIGSHFVNLLTADQSFLANFSKLLLQSTMHMFKKVTGRPIIMNSWSGQDFVLEIIKVSISGIDWRQHFFLKSSLFLLYDSQIIERDI